MVLLPEGFALPPLPHLLVLLAALTAVAVGFARVRPSASEAHVVALAPWIVAGSALHVLYAVGALPAAIRPLAGTPAVYLTVAALAGAMWLAARAAGAPVPTVLAATGIFVVVSAVGAVLLVGAQSGSLAVFWPGVALFLSVPVGLGAWYALRALRPEAAVTGWVGALAVFGHALDGISTAVGVDVLGFGERTPLSRVILEAGAGLPTAELLGTAWLFVLVKVAIAAGVVLLFAEYVEEEPTQGYLLLGFVAAVGLGPGAHNLLLFSLAG